MATRRYKLSVGPEEFKVVEEAGIATVSNTVELTVDLANTAVHDGAATRSISREEVLEILEKFRNHILSGKWLPA